MVLKYFCPLFILVLSLTSIPASGQEMWSGSSSRPDPYFTPVTSDSLAVNWEQFKANPTKFAGVRIRDLKIPQSEFENLRKSTSLRSIEFRLNQDISSDDTIFLDALFKFISGLKQLKSLDINNYYASENMHQMSIPYSIGLLRQLDYLAINANIKQLPSTIANLNEIKKLTISAMGLSSIPDNINAMQRLEEFWIYSNHLNKLPTALGTCSALKYLSLDCSRLEIFEGEFMNLDTLRLFSSSIKKINLKNDGCEFYFHCYFTKTVDIAISKSLQLGISSDGNFEMYFSSFLHSPGYGLTFQFRDSTVTTLNFREIRIPKLTHMTFNWMSQVQQIGVSDDSVMLGSLNHLKLNGPTKLTSLGGLSSYCKQRLTIINSSSIVLNKLLPEFSIQSQFDTLEVNEESLTPPSRKIKRLTFLKVLLVIPSTETNPRLSEREKKYLRRKLSKTQIIYSN